MWIITTGKPFCVEVLKAKLLRFRLTSGVIDDVRSWLAVGRINRVRLQLDQQMDEGWLPDIRQNQIREFLD
jgi:hypothetical protein